MNFIKNLTSGTSLFYSALAYIVLVPACYISIFLFPLFIPENFEVFLIGFINVIFFTSFFVGVFFGFLSIWKLSFEKEASFIWTTFIFIPALFLIYIGITAVYYLITKGGIFEALMGG